jgi:hypothetical protein
LFLRDEANSHYSTFRNRLISFFDSSKGDVNLSILKDITDIQDSLLSESKILNNLHDFEKGQRLLFLFYRDLLPGVKGAILEIKRDRDVVKNVHVTKLQKRIALFFVSFSNFGMLSYVLLFAI